jgi:hypothetical protein
MVPRYVTFLAIFFQLLSALAQSNPQFQRIATFIGSTDEAITGATTDPGNRMIVAGKTAKLLDARISLKNGDTVNLMAENDTNAGNPALFLAVFDTLGYLVWNVVSPSTHSMAYAHIWTIHCDAFGNILIGGNFRVGLLLGSTNGKSKQLKAYTREGARTYSLDDAPYNSFIAKYNPHGELLWAHTGISFDHSAITQIVSDPLGNIFLLAYAHSNSFSLGQQILFKNNGSREGYIYNFDILVIGLNADGNDLWAFYGGDLKSRELVYDTDRGLYIRCTGNQTAARFWHTDGLFYTLREYEIFEPVDLYLEPDGTLRQVLPSFQTKVRARMHQVVEATAGNRYVLTESYAYSPFYRTGYHDAPTFGKTTFEIDSGNFRLIALEPNHEIRWTLTFYSRNAGKPGKINMDDSGYLYLTGLYLGNLYVAKDGNIIQTYAGQMPATYTIKINNAGDIIWYHANAYLDIRTFDGKTSYAIPTGNRLYTAGTWNFDPPAFVPKSKDDPSFRQVSRTDAFVYMAVMQPVPESKSIQEHPAISAIGNDSFLTHRVYDSVKSAPPVCNEAKESTLTFQIFPNPVHAGKVDIHIDISMDEGKPVQLTVTDQNGRLVFKQENINTRGITRISWKTDQVKPGIYYFRLSRDKTCYTRKLVVM